MARAQVLSGADGSSRIVLRGLVTWVPMALVLVSVHAAAATVWNGPVVSFTKSPFADPAVATNQDRLTPTVWLTRASSRGLYNIALESSYGVVPPVLSPLGTRWALGSLANGVQNLTFNPWETTVRSIAPGAGPPDAVGVAMVAHLVADDIYLDLKLTSWSQQTSGGGGFSYERSSAPAIVTSKQVPLLPTPVMAALALILAALGLARKARPRPKGRV